MKKLLSAAAITAMLMAGNAWADALIAENSLGGRIILQDTECYMGDGGGKFLNARSETPLPNKKEPYIMAGCWTYTSETETVIVIWDDPNGPDIWTYDVNVFTLEKGI